MVVESKIEKNIRKALRKSSPRRAWSILMICACIIIFAIFLRFFVFSVWTFEKKYIFACELEICKKNSKKGSLLLTSAHSGNLVWLWQIGKSGEEIVLPTPFGAMTMSIPKKGDTIVFENLSPMIWDASFSLYREQFPDEKAKIDISLWSRDKELPFAYVGKASISGRPVSEKEVAFLPWHELRLLELQLQKIFPAMDSINFKRKVLSDSAEIEKFVASEELFYLSCNRKKRQKLCYDSRERGFFSKNDIKGIALNRKINL